MSKVENKVIRHSALKQILKQFPLNGFAIPLLVLLIILTLESCAIHYKHRKIKHVPCPCETEYRR